MTGAKRNDINRLRDRLVIIQFKEAILWKDDDLQEIILSNSSLWFRLISWLLEQLSGDSLIAEPKDTQLVIQKTIVGLGICNSSKAANLISGKLTVEEKIKLLSRLISLVEAKSSVEDDIENINDIEARRIDHILNAWSEVLGPLDDNKDSPAGMKKRGVPAEMKKKDVVQDPPDLRKIESYEEDYSLCKEGVEQAKKKIERLRKELELEDGVTAVDAIQQLKKEREDLSDKISMLVESWTPLLEEVKNVYETELKDLLPVDVADPIELTSVDSLFQKLECILQVQNNDKALESSVTTLRNKMYNESPRENWSTKKSSSLPLYHLYEDSQHALLK
ncbi:uncharacterized protein [Hetaerina americana]|uniref:uncharacterized protein n=1 Tax=Hetaerina americana TaxID=62018 RepID=UPI003A7F4021